MKGMLDIISMVILLGIVIVWGLLCYLIILGSSKAKTEYERKIEDEEQKKWLRENSLKKNKGD